MRTLALFGIGANRGMQISLKTKLGNCKLAIACQLRKLDEAVMAKLVVKALQFIIWHEVPAKAFAKDESFKRDSEYSPELEKHLIKHSTALLEPWFESIAFETALYERPVKLTAEQIVEALSDDDFAKLVERRKAAKTAPKPAEVETAVAA